jgi:hypothetical protein
MILTILQNALATFIVMCPVLVVIEGLSLSFSRNRPQGLPLLVVVAIVLLASLGFPLLGFVAALPKVLGVD